MNNLSFLLTGILFSVCLTVYASEGDESSTLPEPVQPKPARLEKIQINLESSTRNPDLSQKSKQQRRVVPIPDALGGNKPERGTKLLSQSVLNLQLERQQTDDSSENNADEIFSEIILSADSMEEAELQRKKLLSLGLKIKQRQYLKGLGIVLSIFRVPENPDPHIFLQNLSDKFPDAPLEYNRRYFLLSDADEWEAASGQEYAAELVGFSAGDAANVNKPLAMLDAMVNAQHPVFKKASITVLDATEKAPKPSRHGTAVASLLVGKGQVQGALPEVPLLAVNIFATDKQNRLFSQSDWWLKGLDILVQVDNPPEVVNISFGGGESALLAKILVKLGQQGLVFVAAAGNGGSKSSVPFPANLPEVIAVTAVDAKKRIYSQAAHGNSVSLAAPGVDVWAADIEGGFYATGTSFATPWVSAALALTLANGGNLEDLLAEAEDLGVMGPDWVYGAGLVKKLTK